MVNERGIARWLDDSKTSIEMIATDPRVYCAPVEMAVSRLPKYVDSGVIDGRPWSGFAGFLPIRVYGLPI